MAEYNRQMATRGPNVEPRRHDRTETAATAGREEGGRRSWEGERCPAWMEGRRRHLPALSTGGAEAGRRVGVRSREATTNSRRPALQLDPLPPISRPTASPGPPAAAPPVNEERDGPVRHLPDWSGRCTQSQCLSIP